MKKDESENAAQSRQWVEPGSPRPKKFNTQPSASKVQATVFWDAKGVIMLAFLPKRSTITGVYYANLLEPPSVNNAEVSSQQVFCCKSSHLLSCNGCCRAKRV